MFIESSIEDCWINTDQVVSFEVVKLAELDPDSGEAFPCWFLVAHMRDNRDIKMESFEDPETLEDMMWGYQEQIKEYEQRR